MTTRKMDNTLRRDAAVPDLVAREPGADELSPLSSSSSSSFLPSCKTSLVGKGWTNEKHDLYLDHLESTFLQQLHHSLGLFASCSNSNLNERGSAENLPTSARKQFIDVQDVYSWKMVGSEPILKNRAEFLAVKNPWICQLRYPSRRCTVTSTHPQEYIPDRAMLNGKRKFSNGLSADFGHTPDNLRCHKDSADCVEEFSDQNFVEEFEEEKQSKTMSKRLKTPDASLRREDETHQEWIQKQDTYISLRET